jgi:hypothetical protein
VIRTAAKLFSKVQGFVRANRGVVADRKRSACGEGCTPAGID